METTVMPVQPKVCFEIEEIIGVSAGVGNVKNYCVRWAPTWISGMNLVGCEMLINEFLCGQHQQLKLIPSQLEGSDVDVDMMYPGSVRTSVGPQYNHTKQQHQQGHQLPRQKDMPQEVEQYQQQPKQQQKQHQQQYQQKIVPEEEKQPNERGKRYQGQQHPEPAKQMNHQDQQLQQQQQKQQKQKEQEDQQQAQQKLTLPVLKEPYELQPPEELSEVNQPDQHQSEGEVLDQEQEQEPVHILHLEQLQPHEQQQILQIETLNSEAESSCFSRANGTSHKNGDNKPYPIHRCSVQVHEEIVPQKESENQLGDEFEDQEPKQQKEQQLYFQQQQVHSPSQQSWQRPHQSQKLPPSQQQQQLMQHPQQSDMTNTVTCNLIHKYELQEQLQFVRIGDSVEDDHSNEHIAGPSSLNADAVKVEEELEEEEDSYVDHKSMNFSDMSANFSSWLGEEDRTRGTAVNSKQYSLKPPPSLPYRASSYQAGNINENHLTGSFLHTDTQSDSNTSLTAVDLFKCNACSKSFSRGCDLNHHIRMIHSVASEKKFSCNICDKKFSHHSSVVNHQKLHSGIKPFACAVCHAAFSRKDYLMKHFQRHTKERPYVCIVCDKSFKRTDSLKQHVNKFHKNLTNLNNDRLHQQQ